MCYYCMQMKHILDIGHDLFDKTRIQIVNAIDDT